jgi:putative ABC transport system permease protein
MHLEASRSDILRMILRKTTLTTTMGLAVGLLLSWALSRLMANTLFGIVSLEYSVIISFLLILAIVASFSNLIPAYRAAKTDPLAALRYE